MTSSSDIFWTWQVCRVLVKVSMNISIIFESKRDSETKYDIYKLLAKLSLARVEFKLIIVRLLPKIVLEFMLTLSKNSAYLTRGEREGWGGLKRFLLYYCRIIYQLEILWHFGS